MVPADLEAGESFPSLGLEFQFNIEEPFDNMASMVNQMGTVAAFEKKCSPCNESDAQNGRGEGWSRPRSMRRRGAEVVVREESNGAAM